MKVILLRDVAKIGSRHTVVEVPDGFALNQLIPKKWAEPATPANLKKIATQREVHTIQHKLKEDQFTTAVLALEATPLQIVVAQANEQGHLFKALHESDVVSAAKERGITLLPTQVQITTPLKSLGKHEVVLKHKTMTKKVFVDIIKM